MAKTRMNAKARNAIIAHLNSAVTNKLTELHEIDKLAKATSDAAIKVAEKHWPAKDMKVLEKWSKSTNYAAVSFMRSQEYKDGDGIEQTQRDTFQVALVDDVTILGPRGSSSWNPSIIHVGWDDAVWLARAALDAAVSARDDERERTMQAYRTLVHGARTFDEIVEVLPELAKFKSTFFPGSTALSRVSGETLKTIAEDVARRKAA